ncbi:MAG: AAA family ATPase, partial [Acidimicrobiia bacterium]
MAGSTCSECAATNREGRKFCAQCGAPLAPSSCPACGASNEPGERFCGECGALLSPAAAPIPSPPAPARHEPEGERKQLTVLFADVQGSMDLQEDLDPEAWARIMGRFVEILADGVRRFGGTVDKFTGDGIMALFGAPVAQEDHARRACHAALHLTQAIAAYGEEPRRSQGVDLHVRLGLNSGEVVVGRVGDDVTLDPTALGHAVGLAQRMEAMAEPGRAYLTEHTARLVEGWFRLTDLGPTAVKGAHEALGVFVLEGPSSRSRTEGTSRLVGRAKELALLEDALAAATEGRAQVVGVVGEAGVGKSRLCDEFARSCAARGITVRRATGASHGQEVPLLPVLALLRDYFSISVTDTPAEARERLSGRLLDLDPGLAGDLPLLFDFLEVPDPEHPAPQLAAEVRMRRVFDLLRRLTDRRSERETLVLLVEDVHWFDPQSATFLERLIESYPGTRTLVVANFRPEFSAAWMRHSYYRQVSLAPLGDDAVGELLSGLLGVDLSLAPLLGFVAERTGGNPFFVEEVVRALIEDGTLAGGAGARRLTRPLDQVKVPPSVQAVLAARIDRLPAEHKELLQTAAVIGRSFPQTVLAAVAARSDDDVEDGLRALCAAELLQETQRHPLVEYRFWHPLTQEVAYGTLLAGRRARLHAAAAEALAAHAQEDRPDEQAAII